MSDQNISRQLRSSRHIQNNKHDEKTFLVQENVRTGQRIREQMLVMLSTCDSSSQV